MNQAGDDEIWDYGLRNPWRCAFDPANGDLWIADVGQEAREEIDVERAGTPGASGGHNYGWKCYEGTLYTAYASCSAALPFTAPLYEYAHDDQGGCSITGDVVYRGTAVPGLSGAYLFSDYCNPTLWSLTTPGGTPTRTVLQTAGGATPQGDPINGIVAFGSDDTGETYFVNYFLGLLYKIKPSGCAADLGSQGGLHGPDAHLDNNDFIAFIDYFFDDDARADVGARGGQPGHDAVFDNNDFVVFIDLFFSGC